MPKLTIDNQTIEVTPGTTILAAANALNIEIPTLCFNSQCTPETSCMVCLVKINGQANLVPSCATVAAEGMQIESQTPEVHQARQAALELLLSDHLGDCLGPCQMICPAHLRIPLMLRHIAAGETETAAAIARQDLIFPAVLGCICPHPCEKGCRRAAADDPLAIRSLHRHAAQHVSPSDVVGKVSSSGKRIAIIGAGPTGLAAAVHLSRSGHACTVLEKQPAPGGGLRAALNAHSAPLHILDAEIDLITQLNVEIHTSRAISDDDLTALCRQFDAVLLTCGKLDTPAANPPFPLAATAKGIDIDPTSLQTSTPGIFAAGAAVRPHSMAVRAVASGKAAAQAIHAFLSGISITPSPKPFNVRIGTLQPGEIERFMAQADPAPRARVDDKSDGHLSADQARTESRRCLHCDCRKADSCLLRRHAQRYAARPRRFAHRRTFQSITTHPDVIYEPGKCIDCGLCVQITARSS